MTKKTSTESILQMTDRYVASTYRRYPLVLSRGKGTRVWDKEGREYLDFVSGLAVDNLGHCHPAVVSAIQKQAGQLLHVSNLYHIEEQSKLAAELASYSFARKFFFCNSGTEANEAAIKLARRYFHDQGIKGKTEIITLERSFHGRTYASLSATAQKKYHTGFGPLLPGFKNIPMNDLDAAKRAVTKKTCAILIEPVQGEGGVYSPTKAFLKGLRQLCNRENILLIFDEVQTGFGRTGPLFAYQLSGVRPDIITLAKALGGGMAIGAMGATAKVIKSFVPGTHAATFGGNPLACSAALASLQVLTRKGFLEKASATGLYFRSQLESLQKTFPCVQEVRGAGLMLAMELDRPAAPLVLDCMAQGFLINCVQENTLRFIPPLIVARKEIDRLIRVLADLLGKL